MKTYYAALVALLLLTGCLQARVDENGLGLQASPLASLPRVQEGEVALTDAVTALADKVEGGEQVIADLADAQSTIAQKDITDSEWFWALMALAGIPLVKPTVRGGSRVVGALKANSQKSVA